MPEDDVEVIYLFKRGLVDVKRVTVVEHAGTGKGAALDVHPVGRRYRALFGNRIDWWPKGFSAWIDHASANGFAAPRVRRRRAAAAR
jgi:hypothetical protein